MFQNAYRWLTINCRLPHQVLQWILNPEYKDIYYKVIREQCIRETIRDYEQCHTITEDMITERQQMLCTKYNLPDARLNTLEDILQGDTCFLCARKIGKGRIVNHINESHPSSYRQTTSATQNYAKHKLDLESEHDEQRAKAIKDYQEDFEPQEGPITKRFQTYKCHHCSFTFLTSTIAMIDHTISHRQDQFQKIAVVKNSIPPIYRPEQHYFNLATERYQLQGDTELHDLIIPGSASLKPHQIK